MQLATLRSCGSLYALVRRLKLSLRGCLLGSWALLLVPQVIATENYESLPPARLQQTINREWVFHYFPASDAGSGHEEPNADDSSWSAVAIPHTWQTYETTGELHPFIHDASEKDNPYWWNGWGWYRKHFSIDKKFAGRKIFVEFDGVQKYCKVWLNGRLVGDHKGGYSGFCFDLTDFVAWGQDNLLAVAVNNQQNDGFRIPPMSAGNFDVYGGIYRDVRLVIKNPLYIPFQGSAQYQGGTFVTTPEVSAQRGSARVRTWVRNDSAERRDCELRTTIVDAEGKIVEHFTEEKPIPSGATVEFDQTSSPISHPRLWSPDDPYIYTVYSDVFENGALEDHYESPLGFREFRWDRQQNRLILNGKKIILHGSNRHQEYPWLGDATPKWLHLLDMADFRRNLNFNFMRTVHYPQDPAIYDFCDRNGIITVEEVPNIKRQKFSPEVQEQQLREMIRRDRNHPSIFFWSMGNETDDAVDSKFAVEEDTSRIIHGRDIYNDSGGRYISHTQEQLQLESLLRCTVRGWYNEDVRDLRPRNGQKTGTEEWQHDLAAAEIIRLNQGRSREDMADLCTFLYADHGANREYADCPLRYVNPKGWVDCWREPKYIYYLWEAIYSDRPVLFIHPHFWQREYLGQKKEIVVDSNCESVELKVNGRSIGKLAPRLEEANVVRFEDVPIETGVLSAEGIKEGRTITASVTMAGKPARISLTTAQTVLEAGLDSIAIVRADITDAQGNHVYGTTNQLDWSVVGPARLVGPPTYSSDTFKNGESDGTMYIVTPTFNILRSTGETGIITVRVQSPDLVTGELKIEAISSLAAPTFGIYEPRIGSKKQQIVSTSIESPAPAASKPMELKLVSEDIEIPGSTLEEYTERIDRFIRRKNPESDFGGPEYQSLVSVLAGLLQKNSGHLSRDDFNFSAGFYNDDRCIAACLEKMAFPSIYKYRLRKYYAKIMIEEGQTKDCAREKSWLASLPEGRVVVVGTAASSDPTAIYTNERDLAAILALVDPETKSLSDEQRRLLLGTILSLNPQIEAGQTASPHFLLPKGEVILIPSLQFLGKKVERTPN